MSNSPISLSEHNFMDDSRYLEKALERFRKSYENEPLSAYQTVYGTVPREVRFGEASLARCIDRVADVRRSYPVVAGQLALESMFDS